MTTLPPPGAGEPSAAGALADPPPPPPPPTSSADAVIDTGNTGNVDGLNRCPSCGASEIQLRPSSGMLICLFCRHEWSEARLDAVIDNGDLTSLRGTTVGSGAADIDDAVDVVMTMKCGGCGAEVVINTAEQMGARCHWCRHVFTVNEQVPNGAVPDAVLPFTLTRDEAVTRIRAFAGKRKRFASRGFVRDFTPENVVGVYLPYMVVDGNVSAAVTGHGEVQTRRYTRGTGNDAETFYDADVFAVERQIDFTVDDLTIESSSERANLNTSVNTNNVINAILPFDTENAVRWNASYLTGYTSEKRDQDVAELQPELEHRLLTIARDQVASSVERYDRGVRWERERLDVHGTRFVSMYLPVWLYAHRDDRGGKGGGMIHYIAVNGRTGEVMGSVPVSHRRLFALSAAVGGVVEAVAVLIVVAS